ncbi:hypothetical protein AWB67_07283 [Caballeronia terrestris]|uniref:Uncharacterized protein n=1 Tax=Caballeronia terrestris TaxID=1226301 RepID=A0A158L1H4_9BURK|nr:hypothetical protein AWB67_07283 [Caballeronia terrestris]
MKSVTVGIREVRAEIAMRDGLTRLAFGAYCVKHVFSQAGLYPIGGNSSAQRRRHGRRCADHHGGALGAALIGNGEVGDTQRRRHAFRESRDVVDKLWRERSEARQVVE